MIIKKYREIRELCFDIVYNLMEWWLHLLVLILTLGTVAMIPIGIYNAVQEDKPVVAHEQHCED